jgi:hypothetical protein
MREEWDAWMQRHRTIFGLWSDTQVRSVVEWAEALREAGYMPAELIEASAWLASHEPPRALWDHLPALVERLKAQRQAYSDPPEDPRGECALCGGTGRVIVPHPDSDPCGRWTTMAVLCRCALGRWYGERLTSRNPLTLDAYEARLPDWRRRVERHEQFLRALAEQAERDGARPVSDEWRELVRRILKRTRGR